MDFYTKHLDLNPRSKIYQLDEMGQLLQVYVASLINMSLYPNPVLRLYLFFPGESICTKDNGNTWYFVLNFVLLDVL